MSAEFVEVPNDNEIIEEDYIIEEIDDPIYAMDVKVEGEQLPERDIFSDNDEYAHVVCLGKDDHTGEEVYHCALCNVTFSSIETHLKENHPSTPQEAEETVQLFMQDDEDECSASSEVNQQEVEDGTTSIVCQACDFVFDTMDDAEFHQCQVENLNQPLMCNNCQVIFDNEADIETHQCSSVEVKEEFITSVFSCPECEEKFSSINLLQQHQKTHKLKKPAAKKIKEEGGVECDGRPKNHCSICNTTFTSSKNLKLHAKMHLTIPTKTIKDAMPIGTDDSSDKNQFYCEICNKSFDHALLSVHQNMHQNVEEHNCSICNRQFENQVSYDMHMQLHSCQPTRVRPQRVAKPGARFSCNYCGREFLRPHEKVKHERIHTGEKPHECEVCGKCFRVSYSLTLHLRTHTDVRPFVCAQCNKRFKAYAVYSHHLNTHSEDRPYKCHMCPKSFRTSVQLCGHKNSHTKPYNCPECNRPFASLYAVKMHMKTHNKANKSNENLKHRCGICGAVYARMFALRLHMKEQHSADLTEDPGKDLNAPPITADDCFNEDEVSTQAILQGEEIIIDTFHTEEIVTDWLTSK